MVVIGDIGERKLCMLQNEELNEEPDGMKTTGASNKLKGSSMQ
jgi:hypothetical protein